MSLPYCEKHKVSWSCGKGCPDCEVDTLKAENAKLRERLEVPPYCNRGHNSGLPLTLWDCPACVELLRAVADAAREVRQLPNKGRWSEGDLYPIWRALIALDDAVKKRGSVT